MEYLNLIANSLTVLKMIKIGQAELHNIDCMAYMTTLPDKAFDLAIVDPPYGIDAGELFSGEVRKSGNGVAMKSAFEKKSWDLEIPNAQYFKELLEEGETHNKLYKAVNAFGAQVKRVAQEDRSELEKSGLKFNLHTIIGGQLKDDEEHKLFLLYPEGNWVELGEGAPFVVIGNSGHGKAILNRTLTSESSMHLALKTGFLSKSAKGHR